MLVMHLVRQLEDIPVLMFHHFWDKKQLEFVHHIIDNQGITCFSHRPIEVVRKGNSIMAFYNIDNQPMPVVFDLKETRVCGLEKVKIAEVVPDYSWDVTFVGTKQTDSHELVPTIDLSNFPSIVTPLWEWTDDEVIEACRYLGVEIDERVYTEKDDACETGTFNACLACVGSKDMVYCFKQDKMIHGV